MPSRRDFLRTTGAAAGGALLAPLAARPALAVPVASPGVAVAAWSPRWAPDPARDGLPAFETIEDDRADSHPAGQPHIVVEGDHYRFNMHTVDRDTMTDRQRQEVTGMRSPAGGTFLQMLLGQTWRITYSMFIPSVLKATTTFTHIMQMKQPGTGSLPILTTSLRRHGSVPAIELNVENSGVVIGSADLAPLQDTWIGVEFEMTIGNAPDGHLRWAIRNGASTAVDVQRGNLDTWLADRVRPKWGIYRSLGDTSGSLQNCFLLLRDLRGYQQVAATRYEAEHATISQGTVAGNHRGFSGTGFVDMTNVTGSFVQWSVPAAAAGTASLAIRYANGTTVNRPMDIRVNGAVVAAAQPFPGTGSWDTWATSTVSVPLAAGTNTVRLTATTANGGPNLDYLEL